MPPRLTPEVGVELNQLAQFWLSRRAGQTLDERVGEGCKRRKGGKEYVRSPLSPFRSCSPHSQSTKKRWPAADWGGLPCSGARSRMILSTFWLVGQRR